MKNKKHIKRFNESIEISDEHLINGSGLFNWNSKIEKSIQLKMLKWYNSLSPEEKKYVDDFRNERAMDEYDYHGDTGFDDEGED